MRVYCKGAAKIRHHLTREVHEINCAELSWDAVGGDEGQMGAEIHYEAVFEHPVLGDLTWSLWEYPEGVEDHHDTDVGEHELLEDFDYGLEHEAPAQD